MVYAWQNCNTFYMVMCAGIWYHMNQFYNDRDLSVSYTWVSTASVLAQARCLPTSVLIVISDSPGKVMCYRLHCCHRGCQVHLHTVVGSCPT